MDGDIPDLPVLVELKKRYSFILMVDEAHSLGVLGDTGKGLFEHFNLPPHVVDIWMGTLSKSLCSCGGYVAANQVIIDILSYFAPGFIYSVGLSPANAAAALRALELILEEPERVVSLQKNSEYLLEGLKMCGFNTGSAAARAVIPVILGGSRKAVTWSNKLFYDYAIKAMPIMHPAVEERRARLRFFVSSMHTKEQIDQTVESLKAIS
jgi:7-keto-8-aminopelargonate synthetase-like enzyme